MLTIKTPPEIRKIAYVNKLNAELLAELFAYIKVGVRTIELEETAMKFCERHGVKPAFKGYKGFPFCLCVSLNEEIVHGFPSERVIKNGDIVSVDSGLFKDGYYADAAFTKKVGKVKNKTAKLVETTEECLYRGIETIHDGSRLHDLGKAVQIHATINGFDVVRDFVGHGVGFAVHELPKVPNYVSIGTDWKLRTGMVIAVEPMLVAGTYDFYYDENDWTVITADKNMSAHFEHTVVVKDDGVEVLSKL